jgi:hypothetical protein
MRRSVLEAYSRDPARKLRLIRNQTRKVGLPLFRSDLSEEELTAAGGGESEGEVDVFTFEADDPESTQPAARHSDEGVESSAGGSVQDARKKTMRELIELRFVALVTPSVDKKWHGVVRRLGFELWTAMSPIKATEVRNPQISKEILEDGAMGIHELAKLEGLRMNQFRSVILVDCDVLFHRTFDELFFIRAALAWTHGGWESEKINGGFLVFNPQNPFALEHMLRICEILREGDFRPGSGWRGKGIGWTYGGRTIQGILPHYFLLEAKTPQGVPDDPYPHIEIERCRYNNMVQLEKCKAKKYADVTSNHFTGECLKPWWCSAGGGHHLCLEFRTRWFSVYRELLLARDGEGGFASVTEQSKELRRFVDAEPAATCPRGGFVSLANELQGRV